MYPAQEVAPAQTTPTSSPVAVPTHDVAADVDDAARERIRRAPTMCEYLHAMGTAPAMPPAMV